MKQPIFLLLTALALVAAACGAGDRVDDAAPAAGVPATPDHTGHVQSAPTATATVAAARSQLPVTVQDKDGRAVTVTDVSRIIPLNGEITEIVFALGLGENVVGVDTSATFPPQAQALPNIGYQRSLSAEGILGLNPTVLIGNENAGPPPVIAQLRASGVPLVMLRYSPAVEDVPDKIRAVAAALGVVERGDSIARTTEAEIDAARALAARAAGRPRVAYLNVRGGGTQQIWGEGTAGAAMIAAAGAVDAGTAAGVKGSQPITAESLAVIQPDGILVLTQSLQSVGGIDGLLQIPGIAQTPAGRNRRILEFEDQYLLGMGPRTGQALADLVRAIHPELE